MQIKLYTTKSERNCLTKVLENEVVLNGVLREGSDVLSPGFTISRKEGIALFNYARIDAFARYYYINGVANINQDMWQLQLSVDPLMTWARQIKELNAICLRSASTFNRYLVDPYYILIISMIQGFWFNTDILVVLKVLVQ